MKSLKRSSSALLMLLAMLPAAAFGAQPVEGTMEAYLVSTAKDGTERFDPVEDAAPGETIEYRIHYRNVGEVVLQQLDVVGPIPANTSYVAGTAGSVVDHAVLVSIDGGKTWETEPVRRKRKDAGGVERVAVVGPEEYTQVRWNSRQPLVSGATQTFTYRVKVD